MGASDFFDFLFSSFIDLAVKIFERLYFSIGLMYIQSVLED